METAIATAAPVPPRTPLAARLRERAEHWHRDAQFYSTPDRYMWRQARALLLLKLAIEAECRGE